LMEAMRNFWEIFTQDYTFQRSATQDFHSVGIPAGRVLVPRKGNKHTLRINY
jgi:hypothetical protein